MLRSITAKQFRDWQLYAQIEPFRFDIELRADYRVAQLCSIVANLTRRRNSKAFTIGDFLIHFDDYAERSQPVSNETLIAKFQLITKMFSGLPPDTQDTVN